MFARDDLLRYVRRQRQRLERSLEQTLAAGEVEAIHDLRVASRRANEAVRVMSKWVGRRAADRTGENLRSLRSAFRVTRDLDVLLRSFGEAPTAPQMSTTDLAHLEGLLTSARQRAWRNAVDAVRAKIGPRSIATLEATRKAFARTAPAADDLLRARLRKRWQRRVRDLLEDPPSADSGAGLHPLRLRLKKVRYCTELWEGLAGRGKSDLIKMCTAMQDRLGAWNDHLQAVDWLARLAGDVETAARQPAWSAAVFAYAAQRARLAENLRQEIVGEWPRLVQETEAQFRMLGEEARVDNLSSEEDES